MLGFPLVYFKGMRLMMFQLSGFYCKSFSKSPVRSVAFRATGTWKFSLQLQEVGLEPLPESLLLAPCKFTVHLRVGV